MGNWDVSKPNNDGEPCEDTVSLGVFEQVMWERDVAIDQLKELGYGFGEKPKTGRWIEERTYMECPNCHDIWHYEENQTERFKCCPTCGEKMVEPRESEGEE